MTQLIDVFGDPTLPATGVFADQVRFRSPFADYAGRADVAHLVGLIRTVLTDLRLVRRLDAGPDTMSQFEAGVPGAPEEIQGVLVERRDDDGLLVDAMLTIRPYAGLRASMRAMASLLDADPLPSRAP